MDRATAVPAGVALIHEHASSRDARGRLHQPLHAQRHGAPGRRLRPVEQPLHERDVARALDLRQRLAARPDGTRPDEIAALLDALPDLRPTLRIASPDELVEVFDAFKVTVVFDKANRKLMLAATITSATAYRIVEVRIVP